ncbi:MAG: hypothetical protein K6F56_06600 [Oscillospiraceae bacterium]|nr:hypothetical protein [Oscillospiraceae bacterium]
MREKLEKLFRGRQGMDELSKLLFWCGVGGFALALVLPGALRVLLTAFSTMLLALAFLRAFSRDLPQREAENLLLLRRREKRKRERAAAKDRRTHRREYKYFKCPGCGTWLRVPRGKGKIHINCRCGYTLYRRT